MNTRTRVFSIVVLAGLAAMFATPLLAQSPSYSNFISTANLVLNGNAAPATTVLRLTPAQQFQVGSAWFNRLQPVAGGFSTTFTFQITPPVQVPDGPPPAPFPADGFAFVIQNSARGTAALGQSGGAIGYGGTIPVNSEAPGIENSLAIEFDTFANPWDPEFLQNTLLANHVAIQSCRTLPNTVDHTTPCEIAIAPAPVTLSDGKPHTAQIEYTPAIPCGGDCSPTPASLQVTIDGRAVFEVPVQVDLSATTDVSNAGGTVSGSSSGLSLTGSNLFKFGSAVGSNLGSVTFTTGAFTSGNAQMGGALAAGGNFQVVGNGTNGVPNGVIFSAPFTSAQWSLTTLVGGTHSYTLTGALGDAGATTQLTVNTGTNLFSESAQLSSGDTSLAFLNLANPSDTTADSAYVGFTAATGSYVENNDILSWTFTPHESQTITQPARANVFTTFNFGSYLYKVRPNQSIDALTVTEVPTDSGTFNPGPNFPGAQCIIYDSTGGKCVEFHAACSSPSNNACNNVNYDVVTSYDVPSSESNIKGAGFLKATGQDCTPATVFDQNIITAFFQTRTDPTTKGKSKPSFSCFVAVQKVTYSPADVDIANLANPKVKTGSNLTYIIPVLNFGPASAQGVVITDTIPSGTNFVNAALCTFASGCSTTPCSVSGGAATCEVGTLDPFALQVMVLVVNVTATSGKITDTATTTFLNHDPRPADNIATAITVISNKRDDH